MKESGQFRELFRSAIRNVLLTDWDPHNAARLAEASGTYDGYIDPLMELMEQRAGEEALMDWLHEREKESMCFPSLGKERLRRVAQKLLEARKTNHPETDR